MSGLHSLSRCCFLHYHISCLHSPLLQTRWIPGIVVDSAGNINLRCWGRMSRQILGKDIFYLFDCGNDCIRNLSVDSVLRCSQVESKNEGL